MLLVITLWTSQLKAQAPLRVLLPWPWPWQRLLTVHECPRLSDATSAQVVTPPWDRSFPEIQQVSEQLWVHRQQALQSSGVQRWLPYVVRSTGLGAHNPNSNPVPCWLAGGDFSQGSLLSRLPHWGVVRTQ